MIQENISNTGIIVLYQPDETTQLDVIVEHETVWLTQSQMVQLFQRDVSVISRHISNIFKEGELDKESNLHFLQIPFSDKPVVNYSLDVIISVGHRVKSKRGTQFRIWARDVLKEYLLKGIAINQRFEQIEQRVAESEKKIDFLVKASREHSETNLRNEIIELKQYIESVLTNYENVNEGTRNKLELAIKTLSEIQYNQKLLDSPRKRIGYQPTEV